MNPLDTTSWPSPTGVAAVLDDALQASGGHDRLPPLTYLRRKPGRGMVAVYGSAASGGSIYTVSVDESAMSIESVRGSAGTPVSWAGTWAGEGNDLFEVPALGVTIERFPHDERLRHLAAAMAPAESGALWLALEAAAAEAAVAAEAAATGAAPARAAALRAVEAIPLRYKPGDRCVIRYVLHSESASGERRRHTVVGKLYGDLDQARDAAELMAGLWNLQDEESWAARPLAVAYPLPLVLAEDLGDRHSQPPTLVGTDVIRFVHTQPVGALRGAARALADLHTSSEPLPAAPARTGADEAVKATKRSHTLGRHVPELADEAARVAQTVGNALTSLTCERLVPSHGSYKPSQLLFRSGSVFLVDFDQFCHADSALDVGYFLAYLRPPGLWYRRAGARAWFDEAAATFLAAYDERLAERGVDPGTRSAIQRRSHVYEAALLLKIAARRANRLHSPRPGEVRALLAEMTACLAAAAQG